MGTRSARLVAAVQACLARLACYGGNVTQAARRSEKIAPEAATDTHPPNPLATHPPPLPARHHRRAFLFE